MGQLRERKRVLWLEHIKKTPIALVGHSIRANRAANPHACLNAITTYQVLMQKQTSFSSKGRMKSYVCFAGPDAGHVVTVESSFSNILQSTQNACLNCTVHYLCTQINTTELLLTVIDQFIGVNVVDAIAKLQPNKCSTAIRTFKSDLFSVINEIFLQFLQLYVD